MGLVGYFFPLSRVHPCYGEHEMPPNAHLSGSKGTQNEHVLPLRETWRVHIGTQTEGRNELTDQKNSRN